MQIPTYCVYDWMLQPSTEPKLFCSIRFLIGKTKWWAMDCMSILTINFFNTLMVVVWWCRPHPVREHAQDLRPPLGARPASPPTRQAAQPPPRGPSTNPRPLDRIEKINTLIFSFVEEEDIIRRDGLQRRLPQLLQQ